MPYDEQKIAAKIKQIISAHDKLETKATNLKQIRFKLLGLQPMEYTVTGEDGKPKQVKQERIYGKTGKPFTKKDKDELADEYLAEAEKMLSEIE